MLAVSQALGVAGQWAAAGPPDILLGQLRPRRTGRNPCAYSLDARQFDWNTMTPSVISRVFGPKAELPIKAMRSALHELPAVQYTIMPLSQFNELLAADMAGAMRIYWREMLYRSHLAGAVGLRRIERWTFATTTAAEGGSLYGFAAALRGLLEACADTHDALADALNNVADSHTVIRRALDGHVAELTLHPHLEDVLLHFTYAGKQSKRPDGRPVYKPKPTTDYIRALKDSAGLDYLPLYGRLCDITHPADASLFMYVESDGHSRYRLGAIDDSRLIDTICQAHRHHLAALVPLGFLPALYLLCLAADFAEARLPAVTLSPELSGPVWDDVRQRVSDTSPPRLEYRSPGGA